MADVDVKDVLWPLQKAVYARLNGDSALIAQVSGIYDDVPGNPTFPYVQIGIATSGTFQTHSRPGDEVTIFVDIFSQYEGMKEALEIKDDVDRLLADRTDLVVSGFYLVGIWKLTANTLLETFRGSKHTRHVALRYRAVLQQQ